MERCCIGLNEDQSSNAIAVQSTLGRLELLWRPHGSLEELSAAAPKLRK